ncbi:butyrophilin subfamily 3 member A1-like [Erinaceus europaeus]|uniref:Butyrophilin subfamily 3 member A1-like n=1 Tax=Erinaceus europaeus TaxID=9365 RepID=A0A1S3A650_ERIEU|nr:butyrophilin subfamily 3 member A1-like [Erinaceus europaeus]
MEVKVQEACQNGYFGQFRVLGPGAPVIAPVGKEAVLSCHLSPETDAEGMEVTWFRMDPPALVHRYVASQDHLEDQSPEYLGRTEFLKENTTTGQVALRIHPILPSDDGEYRCNFASSKLKNETEFKVLVTASGTAPQIHIEPGSTGEVKLTCTSRGWYPEPEVQWRDLQGRRLTPASETKRAAGDGLFHVQTSVTVDTRSRDVSCAIRNPVLSEEKEAHVSMAGSLLKEHGSLVEKNAALTLQLVLKYARRFTEDITLDEKTAHPLLQVSQDRKYVRSVEEKQDVPDNPEDADNPQQFDTHRAVLGRNSFSAGNHYWEVDVARKDRWEIGLCTDSVTRKGDISVCLESGFWVLSLENGEYKALSTPPSILSIPEAPLVVGIFLQYEKGLISFFNVTDCSLLYTFKSIFTESLKPYFYPGPLTWGNMRDLHLPSCQ